MNESRNTDIAGGADDAPLDLQLRLQLKGLRREQPPQHDLWPQVSARIAQVTREPGHAACRPPVGHKRGHWQLPIALAASVVVALGVAWQLRPGLEDGNLPAGWQAPSQSGLSLHAEALAMSREYEHALRQLRAAGDNRLGMDAELGELDRSAEQIREAMRRDPQARFLLDRLRSTYAKRLQLTQRGLDA